MQLEYATGIESPPDQVFAFFEEMEGNYERWHPDHISFRWIEGDGLAEGAVAIFEERIGGKRQEKTVRFTSITRDRSIEFVPTSRLIRLLIPRISFTIEPRREGCTLTQRIRIRTGPIGARLNRREFDDVRQHMREEGENLKRIVEAAT